MAKETKAKAPAKSVKSAKSADYKDMDEKKLLKAIEDLRQEVTELKRGTMLGDVQNVRAYKFKRRELARALTARNLVREEK